MSYEELLDDLKAEGKIGLVNPQLKGVNL